MTAKRSWLLGAILISTARSGCGANRNSAAHPRPAHSAKAHAHAAGPATPASADDEIAAVARIHGGAGPWAVAGYRMGRFALGALGLEPGSFDLEVIHHSPR